MIGFGSILGIGSSLGMGTGPHDLVDIFGNQILAQWPLWGDQLVTDDTAFTDPNDLTGVDWIDYHSTRPGANTMREDATTDFHFVSQNITNATGPIESFSFDVEADGRDIAILWQFRSGYNVYHSFLLSTGEVGNTKVNATASITNLGSGRYRCTVYPTIACNGSPINTRVGTLASDSYGTHAGDITKGLKIYNAQINQTSIVTAPNILNPGTYDLTQATKANQPVLVDDIWNGLPAAVFSASNWMAADAISANYTGVNPWFMLGAATSSVAGVTQYLAMLGNSGTVTPYKTIFKNTSNYLLLNAREDGGPAATVNDLTVIGSNRMILGVLDNKTTGYTYQNGVQTLNGATGLGTTTLNRFTLGTFRGPSVSPSGWSGAVREVIMGLQATDAQMLTASNYFIKRNPII